MLYFGQFDITFVFLIFSKTTVSNRTGWPTAEVGHFIDIIPLTFSSLRNTFQS